MLPNGVGDKIREYRGRMLQAHSERPWSQEVLAVAIGSDKAHINRLECGRQVPALDTLNRISAALGLEWHERRSLLTQAGFLIQPPEPTDGEVFAIVSHSRDTLRSLDYPSYLIDQQQRLWDVNDLAARLFLGFPDVSSCLEALRGRRLIDLAKTPPLSAWFHDVLADFPSFMRRCENLSNPSSLTLAQVEEKLTSPPEFLDHQLITVVHPTAGEIAMQAWQSRLAADDRFSVVHMLPTTDQAKEAFLAQAATASRNHVATKVNRRSRTEDQACITIIVPWAAGGATDVGARILAPLVAQELGRPVRVVNKAAAASRTGLLDLTRQKPDGLNLGFINLPAFATQPGERMNEESLTLIINQSLDPVGVFVRADSPYDSLEDLIHHSLKAPNEITVGTSGPFTPAHIGALMLERAAGVSYRFKHMRGSSEHISRFLAGETDVAFFGSGNTLPAIRAGRLRALAMYTKERFSLLPEVPTGAELSFPSLMLASARGIAAPPRVSREIVQRLQDGFRVAIQDPIHRQQMAAAGLVVRPLSGEAYTGFVRRQGEVYRQFLPPRAPASGKSAQSGR